MDGDPFGLCGEVLEGQFRVDSFAGEGDLSVVYKCHHLGVDAPVAVKFLNLPATLDPALVRPLVAGFKESSRVHYRLARGNPNIAQSIGSGTTVVPRTGVVAPYLVREWFEGESLASDLMRRRNESRAGRSVEDALVLLETAFDGVAHAHQQGEVHLALNPSNLFLARRGDAVSLRVLDFGIGRTMNDFAPGGASVPRPKGGLRVLLPAYAAPEQLDQTIGKLGPWTDVYALALVTMEVLSDRLVMAEQETGALVTHALDRSRRPSPHAHGLNLSPDLELVLTRAVSLAPGRRQESAAVLWRDIKSAARATPSRDAVAAVSAPVRAKRLVKVPPPLPTAAEGPPRTALLRPRTIMGMGSSSLAVAPLQPSSIPSVETLPMSFEPASSPAAGGDMAVRLATESMPTPTLAISDGESPNELLAPPTPAVGMSFDPAPLPRNRLSRQVMVGSLVAMSLLVAAIGALLRRHPVADQTPISTSTYVAPAVAAAPAAAPSPLPPPEPVVSASAPVPAPTSPFTVFAARRALDATSRSVLGCRRDKTWGVAQARVTFANDGSVSHVAVGVPFAGTQSGACVADELSAAHIAPFSGKPGVLVYQFFVAPKG